MEGEQLDRVRKLLAAAKAVLSNLKAARLVDLSSPDRGRYVTVAYGMALAHGLLTCVTDASAQATLAYSLLQDCGLNEEGDTCMVQLYDWLTMKQDSRKGDNTQYYKHYDDMPPKPDFELQQAITVVQLMVDAISAIASTLEAVDKKKKLALLRYEPVEKGSGTANPTAKGVPRGHAKRDMDKHTVFVRMGDCEVMQPVTDHSILTPAPMLAYSMGMGLELSAQPAAIRLVTNAVHYFANVYGVGQTIPLRLLTALKTGAMLTWDDLWPGVTTSAKGTDLHKVSRIVDAYTAHRMQVYGERDLYTSQLHRAKQTFAAIWDDEEDVPLFFTAWDLASKRVNQKVSNAVYALEKAEHLKGHYGKAADLVKGIQGPSWIVELEAALQQQRAATAVHRLAELEARDSHRVHDALVKPAKERNVRFGGAGGAAKAVPKAGGRQKATLKRGAAEAGEDDAAETDSESDRAAPRPEKRPKASPTPKAKPAPAQEPAPGQGKRKKPHNPKYDSLCWYVLTPKGCTRGGSCLHRHIPTAKELDLQKQGKLPTPRYGDSKE